MPSESDNYAKGRSGTGGPVYSSPSWIIGDLERQRLLRETTQRANANAYIQPNNNGAYIQSSSSGEGCATAIFPMIAYAIVLSAAYTLIMYTTKALSSAFALSLPAWLPGVVVLIISCIVLFYRRYIRQMVLISIVVLIGNSILFNDEESKKVSQHINTARTPTNIQQLRERLKDDVPLTHTPPKTKKEIATKELLRKQKITHASIPKTSNLKQALTSTLNLTSTTNEFYKMTGTRSALSLPRQEKEFCADTMRLLKKVYTGSITKFDCNYKQVTVTTPHSSISYSASKNQAVTVK